MPDIYSIPFSDNAESMSNWVGEGTWGLDVGIFRGGAAVPALAGDSGWDVTWVNCSYEPQNVTTTPTERTSARGCNTGNVSNNLTDPNFRATWDGAGNSSVNGDDRWFVKDFVSGSSFDFDMGNDEPPGAPTADSWRWHYDYGAEVTRTLTISEPFRYQFYLQANGGRVGVTPFPTTSEVQALPPRLMTSMLQ